jgi:hypothetical protein
MLRSKLASDPGIEIRMIAIIEVGSDPSGTWSGLAAVCSKLMLT